MFVADLREVGGGLRSRIRRLWTMIERITLVPLLLKLGVLFWMVVAIAIAMPPDLLFNAQAIPLLLVGLAAAVTPRTRMVTVATLIPAGCWVVTTTAFDVPVTLPRLLLLASALYLLHSTAALAGQLPYDAIVSPAVLVRWYARVGIVLAATAVVGAYVLVVGQLLHGTVSLLATVVGFAVAVGLAALLVRLLRR